ncbi:subtilisin-like protease SBT5.3 [Wolffia australiana]
MGSSLVMLRFGLVLQLWILTSVAARRQSYIVYMGEHPEVREEDSFMNSENITASHHDFLGSFLGREKARDSIFYSYTRVINGFAAFLEEEEADEISKSPGVLGVFPNTGREVQTTRSWEFMGLETANGIPVGSLWSRARFGEDVIIGNLDTGVWPESASFSDAGLGPVPSKWKGTCAGGTGVPVTCNRKLIGARFFNKGYQAAGGRIDPSLNTPRDPDGHGTHTLATAGGAFVPRASAIGFGSGTAKGGSPRARVAAYRVCWPRVNGIGGCYDADLLAAFEAAIQDGVDVISVSIAGEAREYLRDGMAIGSFHAAKRGISVVFAGGNAGPGYGTVTNVAPWIFTVAASTMDREFTSFATIGNGVRFKGQSLSTSSLPPNRFFPLIVSTAAASSISSTANAEFCQSGSLNPEKVKGKIVICAAEQITAAAKGVAVSQAGGIGMILINSRRRGYDVEATPFLLPAVTLSYEDGLKLLTYTTSTAFPIASISAPFTELGTRPAPFMGYFSSRGPNNINPEILKPDITAPGLRVVAAFTGAVGPSDLAIDTRRVPFSVFSGTSMACPHIAGVVGLLKALHPDWSPAAIKSAIMTTATTQDNRGVNILDSFFLPANPFSYGAGHVQPNRAADPGLVYDLTVTDYLNFLCAKGYTSSQIFSFQQADFSCPLTSPRILDMNYPSITVPSLASRTTVNRRLKNVGPSSTYTVRILPPPGVLVTVAPNTLQFTAYGQERAFTITFEPQIGAAKGYTYGRLIWSDSFRSVTSPLVIGIV